MYTRAFSIQWDTSTKEPKAPRTFTREGCYIRFSNGKEAYVFDFEIGFTSRFDLDEHFRKIGNMTLAYADESAPVVA